MRWIFLWGYLEDRVYRDAGPKTLNQLKQNIVREVRRIKSAVIGQVTTSVKQRARDVIAARDVWLEHVRNYWLSVKLQQNEQFLIDFVEFNWNKMYGFELSLAGTR